MRQSKSCLPFRCNICKERFLFWERREDHLVEAHGKEKKLFRCTECERVFERRTLLYFHFKAAHTDDHKCTYCELTFSTRRDLREHTHLHTGERPLKCHVCDKTFTRDKALKQHLVIHDDSKRKYAVYAVDSSLIVKNYAFTSKNIILKFFNRIMF